MTDTVAGKGMTATCAVNTCLYVSHLDINKS